MSAIASTVEDVHEVEVDDWFADTFDGSYRRLGLMVLAGLILGGTVAWQQAMLGNFPGWWSTAALACVVAALPVLTAVDYATFWVPNQIIHPLAAVALSLVCLDRLTGGLSPSGFWQAVAMGAGVWAALHAVWWLSDGGFGYGDVRLMTVCAFVLGTHSWWLPLVAVLALPVWTAAPVGLALAVLGHRRPLPFVPFIALGVVACSLFTAPLADLLESVFFYT